MTMRRGGRPAHVRPRPPSTGRPAPAKARPRPSTSGRVATHKPIRPTPAVPLLARLLLVAAIVALGFAVFTAGTGGLGALGRVLGSGFSAAFDRLTATPVPTATAGLISGAPAITAPAQPYTNKATVDLQVAIPTADVGAAGTSVRIYLALSGQKAAPIGQVPVGATPTMSITETLTPGQNDFSATIVTPAGESAASPVVTYVLDTQAPKISLSSPRANATVNGPTVDLVGVTQPGATIVARNAANSASITGSAAANGSFKLTIAIDIGDNAITIQVSDPAGNVATLATSVQRGTGAFSAKLSASSYRISQATLPAPLTLTVLVTDPNGAPVAGATVTFSLTLPAIPPLTFTAQTGTDGRASATTTLPKDVTAGSGLATVIVTSTNFGAATDRTVITVIN